MTLLRSKPVDWTRGSGRPVPPRAESVDVVVPVFGAAAELDRCLTSVLEHTDLRVHGLLLVMDGPQGDDVESVIRTHAEGTPGTRVIRNETRLGFVGSANRGMAASSEDVVLLNSDTVVTARWVDKLIDAAMSSGDVATVTPLSNNATLCSIPRAFEENGLPSGHDARSFGELVERVSTRARPRLPTGVGVCLYIRRAAIDDVGLFDEESFGLGYGEENDFCFRALARGWVHVVDDATFIEHSGHGSFGRERLAAQRAAEQALSRLHPSYMATIARFMSTDPLADVRRRVVNALRVPLTVRRAPQRIVHLVHGWPPWQNGGTEVYAAWLAREQIAWRDVSVYARMDDPSREEGEAVEVVDRGIRVRRLTKNFTSRDPRVRNAMSDERLERDFERFLHEENPGLLHVHHYAGHAFSLARVARRLAIPIVQQIQDWWAVCGRVNLFDSKGRRCEGPGVVKCAQCAPLTQVPPAPLWNRVLHRVRRAAARDALRAADAYVAGSRFILDDYRRAGLLREGVPAFVLPYGVTVAQCRRDRSTARPIRFGIVGSVLPHKGLHVAAEAFRTVDRSNATLRAWGSTTGDPEYAARLAAAISIEGPFGDTDKESIFESIDVLIVPSIGLESFGIAAREAMARGVPVITANDGALTELFDEGQCGEWFPNGDAHALRSIVERIVEMPSIVDEWARNIPEIKSVTAHAEEIETVYDAVLAGRR